MADIIGTTPESISRFFKPLKKNGILEIKRGMIYIKDAPKLKSLINL
jgi:DNA-binding transcriptional regulator YhcF (GntR family)